MILCMAKSSKWGRKLVNFTSDNPDTYPIDSLLLNAIGSMLMVWACLVVAFFINSINFGLFAGTMLAYLVLIMLKSQKPIWSVVLLIYLMVNILAIITLSYHDNIHDDWRMAMVVINLLVHTITAVKLFNTNAHQVPKQIGMSLLFLLCYGLPSLFGMAVFLAISNFSV